MVFLSHPNQDIEQNVCLVGQEGHSHYKWSPRHHHSCFGIKPFRASHGKHKGTPWDNRLFSFLLPPMFSSFLTFFVILQRRSLVATADQIIWWYFKCGTLMASYSAFIVSSTSFLSYVSL